MFTSPGLEKETLDVMWKMSEVGSGAEHCFLRAPQREFYTVPQADPSLLSVYPNVDLSASQRLQRLTD